MRGTEEGEGNKSGCQEVDEELIGVTIGIRTLISLHALVGPIVTARIRWRDKSKRNGTKDIGASRTRRPIRERGP